MGGLMYWGYLHQSGSIQVKRFHHMSSIEDAYESEFVIDVCKPFVAESTIEAIYILIEHFEIYYELPEYLYE